MTEEQLQFIARMETTITAECETCAGSGGGPLMDCPACEGTGQVQEVVWNRNARTAAHYWQLKCMQAQERVAELESAEDLLARMCHDESGLIEAGRESERAALLRELLALYGLAGGTDPARRGLVAAIDVALSRGSATLLPPDVVSARIATYEQALKDIEGWDDPSAPLAGSAMRARAREALKKGKAT